MATGHMKTGADPTAETLCRRMSYALASRQCPTLYCYHELTIATNLWRSSCFNQEFYMKATNSKACHCVFFHSCLTSHHIHFTTSSRDHASCREVFYQNVTCFFCSAKRVVCTGHHKILHVITLK